MNQTNFISEIHIVLAFLEENKLIMRQSYFKLQDNMRWTGCLKGFVTGSGAFQQMFSHLYSAQKGETAWTFDC